jgi:sugar phosphate permease
LKQELTPTQRHWRWRMFILTWLVYAGFYFCRKNFSVVMPELMADLGYTKLDLAWAISGYSLMYMLGQFANGMLNDRLGPRLMLTVGMLVSVASNILMGVSSALFLFIVLRFLNGAGQSTGWSGTVKNMTQWFSHGERGVVMAWWGTCYALGGAVATLFATYCITNEVWLTELGWRRGFFAPAIVLGIVAVAYGVFARNTPTDAGLDEIATDDEPHHGSDDGDGVELSALRIVLTNPAVWTLASTYFFIKLMRYAFLDWLPTYMSESLNYSTAQAGYISAVYDWFGFLGVIIAGYVSDKLMQSRRFPVCAIMLFCLGIAMMIHPALSQLGMVANAIGIAAIGIFTFGPDALMTGPAAMDAGGKKAAGTAAGFINGVGSIGQLVSPFAVALIADTALGWNGLFYTFVVLSLISAALMATRWHHGGNSKAA